MTDTPQLTPEKAREPVANDAITAAGAVIDALNRAQAAAMMSMQAAARIQSRENAVVKCVLGVAVRGVSCSVSIDDALTYLDSPDGKADVAAALAKLEVE